LEATGDKFGEGGLSGSGRPSEKERRHRIGIEHPPQQLSRPKEMGLTDELLKGGWP
jgi:hypothetical protein